MLHNSSLPAAPLLRRTAILDILGIPKWFFQSCYREDIASRLRRNSWKLAVLLYSICPLCATLHGHCAVICIATLTWVVWHLVYISSWLTRNLGNCRRLLALPRLDIYLMLFLVSVHFFSLLLLTLDYFIFHHLLSPCCSMQDISTDSAPLSYLQRD